MAPGRRMARPEQSRSDIESYPRSATVGRGPEEPSDKAPRPRGRSAKPRVSSIETARPPTKATQRFLRDPTCR